MTTERLRPDFTFDKDRIEELMTIVPEAFADGKINWEVLHSALGDYLEPETADAEHFGLFWPGKREARRLASIPSTGTLVPAKGEGIDEDKTHNLFIEGDNLEVLKLLQKSYAGHVKMIYIDPPYNTGNDFIYPDDFRDPIETYLRVTGQSDSDGIVLSSNPETGGRFHSNWLSMMYPRLLLAKQLLRENGLIFVSIDDHEFHHLRTIMNEVFGEENFIGALIWKRRQLVDSRAKTGLSIDHEYLIVYGREVKSRLRGQEKDLSKYSNPNGDPRGPWFSADLTGLATEDQRPNLHYVLVNPDTGNEYPCPENGWRYSKSTMARLIADGKIIWPTSLTGRPRLKRYQNEMSDEFTGLSSILSTVSNTQGTREMKEMFDGKEVMDFPKPVQYMKLIIQQGTSIEEEDIILDFFAGSCPVAQATMELNREDGGNRRFIMAQLPEPTSNPDYPTIAEIGKERIRRAIIKLGANQHQEDLGFKVFKLNHSNYKAWVDYYGEDIKQLEMLFDKAETPLAEGWTPETLLTEIMLIQGFPLDSKITSQNECKQNEVKTVTSTAIEHRLMVCLDDKIKVETLTRLKFKPGDIFVCLDSAVTDQAKMRLANKCILRTI